MYEWIGLRSLRENLNRKPLLHCFSYGIWGCPVIFPLNKSIDLYPLALPQPWNLTILRIHSWANFSIITRMDHVKSVVFQGLV